MNLLRPSLLAIIFTLIIGGRANAATAPLITQQPVSATVAAGNPVTFSVSAFGDPTLSYQWQKAGADIESATESSYVIPSVQAADAAAYTVTITNGAGNQTSAPAVLVVGTKAIRYVKSNATGANNGSSWANAFTSLTSALTAAVDGDEIWVAAGTYKPSTVGNRDSYFAVAKVLTILGGFAGTESTASERNWNTNVTILSGDLAGNDTGPGGNQGDNSKQVMVYEANANAVIDGFRITGGNAPAGSGSPDAGGGIFIGDGRVATVRNCTFYWNYAISYGGGLGSYAFGALTLEGCYFHHNSAPVNGGGGMFLDSPPGSHCIIKRSLFANNSGSAAGAALFHNGTTSYIENSVFTANSSGGGLQSGVAAGAIRGFTSAPGRFWITNCTFSANTNTRGTAGAISLFAPNDGNSMLANSIVVGSGSAPVTFPTAPAYLLSDQSIAGTDNIVGTPTFVNSGNPLGMDGVFGTRDDGFVLAAASPGIDTGSTAVAPLFDATEVSRPQGSEVDRGAYESLELPVITFKSVTAPPFALPALAPSGLPVLYVVVGGSQVATVDGNMVTLSGQTGAVTIRATQAETVGWAAAQERYLTFMVEALPQWKSVFTGSGAPGNWTAALREDGTIWTWGSNASANLGISALSFLRRPSQMGTDADWRSLAASETGYSFAAIKSDGRLFTWGNNSSGQLGLGHTTTSRTPPVLVNSDTDWEQVAVGSSHMVALKLDGSLWAWGLNSSGQLGDGTTTSTSVPIRIGIATDWATVATGSASTHALKDDGTLWAWGSNSSGRLGDGTTANRTTPTRIGTATDWVMIDGGNNHTLAVKADGSLWAWGANADGQVGDATQTNQLQPVPILPGNQWARVYAGRGNSLAVRSDGTLWAWGLNSRGQLGDGSTDTQAAPVQIGTDTDWREAACANHSAAIKQDKTLWSWGTDVDGELGNGSWWPQPVAEVLGPVRSFAGGKPGTNFTLVVRNDGSLWALGTNTDGKLGLGLPVTALIREPGRIGMDADWTAVTAGQSHAAALKADGSLWTWGRNAEGQLGDGTLTSQSLPARMGVDNDWKAVAAGLNHTLAIRNDGSLWAWGSNVNGELGDGTVTQRNLPVRIGTDNDWVKLSAHSHSLALKLDGSLWAWGPNLSGQVGDGSTTAVLAPVRIGTESNWVRVSAGLDHSLALRADGSLWAWGSNVWGQTPNGTRTEPGQVGTDLDWRDIAAGSQFTLALKQGGSLWTSGSGYGGRLGHGTGTARDAYNLWTLTRIGELDGFDRLPDGGIKGDSTLAATATGELWGAGQTIAGQIGNIRYRPIPKPVFADLMPQTLSLPAVNIAASGAFQLQGTASSGLPVKYKVSGPAVLEGDRLRVLGSEQVTLIAWQEGDKVWDIVGPMSIPVNLPEIAVEELTGADLVSGSSSTDFGPIRIGGNTFKSFAIRNTGTLDLTGIDITFEGVNAADFYVTEAPSATVVPAASSTLTIIFAPTGGASGVRSATLRMVSNDIDENPFDIALSGQAFSTTLDADSDGMNDWQEFRLSSLGFNWQTPNNAMVATYFAVANENGLFTSTQVQDLNIGRTLIQRNPTSGEFTITFGLEKSTNLSGWAPFPLTAPQTSINGQGKVEFIFTVPDNAAFFRLQAQ